MLITTYLTGCLRKDHYDNNKNISVEDFISAALYLLTELYSAHGAEILKMIAEMKNENFNFQTHGARLDQQVIKKFLLSYQEDEHFYLVLPNVALGQEYYETSMPVLMMEKNKLNIILSKMFMDNIDFISIFTTAFKAGILIDGYSDFSCEKNNHQDGQVYDYYILLVS